MCMQTYAPPYSEHVKRVGDDALAYSTLSELARKLKFDRYFNMTLLFMNHSHLLAYLKVCGLSKSGLLCLFFRKRYQSIV